MKSKVEIIRDFLDATNRKDWSKVKDLISEDFIRHSSSEPKEIKSSEGLINFHKGELEAFPDINETLIFAIEENDMVAARINFSGTQLGPLGKFPPSGKRLNADYNCFFRIAGGKIKESWVEYDNLNGLIQLGHFKMTE